MAGKHLAAAPVPRAPCHQRLYSSSAADTVTTLTPITWRLVSSRRKPGIVKQQNRNAASEIDSSHRACRGVQWVNPGQRGQTLKSIKYEIVGGTSCWGSPGPDGLCPSKRQLGRSSTSVRLLGGGDGKRLIRGDSIPALQTARPTTGCSAWTSGRLGLRYHDPV